MRSIAGILLSVLIVQVASAQVASDQVLTRDQLMSRGVYRLGDIGHMFASTRTASVDGYATSYSIAGLSPLGHNGYKVIVDGHEIEVGFWDFKNLTSLGIPVTDVDSIRVVEHPVAVGGMVAPAGLVEIWTREYSEAVTTSLSTFAGNESGDPGPFRYSQDLGYANVDKIGPDAAAGITINQPDALFSASLSVSQLIPSDDAVFDRNRKIFDEPTTPEVRIIAPRVRVGFFGDKFSSDAQVLASTDRDMFFSSAIAREIPVDIKQMQAGWLGTAHLNQRTLNVKASYRFLDVSNLSVATRIPVNWNESILKGDVSLEFSTAFLSEIGIRTMAASGHGFDARAIDRHRSLSIYANSRKQVGGATVSGHVNAGRHNDVFTWGLMMAASVRSGKNTLRTHSSAMRLPRLNGDRVGAWLGSGLTVSPEIPTQSIYGSSYGLYTADISWNWHDKASGFSLSVTPSLRYFQDIDLHSRTVQADGAGYAVVTNRSQRSDGTMAGFAVSGARSHALFTPSVTFDFRNAIQGDRYFMAAMREIPVSRILAQATVTPASSFNAVVAATYQSGSTWSEFRFLENDPETLFSSTVDDVFKLDMGISKTFWTGRVRMQVMVENIFNDHVSYHPIGARFDRTMKLTAHVRLD